MVVLDDEAGFYAAAAMVADNPHPEHLAEYVAAEGISRDMRYILDESISRTRVAAYAFAGDDIAVVCGIGHGIHRAPVWMTTTANAGTRPRWLFKTMLRLLAAGERHVGRGVTLWQAIPFDYPEGIHFVRHLGFREIRMMPSPRTGHPLILVEKEIR